MSDCNWLVYIVRCADDTLYTGISNDLERRLRTHNEGRGAKYLRGRGPVVLAYLERGYDRAAALRREAQLKKLNRTAKLELIRQAPPIEPND